MADTWYDLHISNCFAELSPDFYTRLPTMGLDYAKLVHVNPTVAQKWMDSYLTRINQQDLSHAQRRRQKDRSNPLYVLRT